MERREENGRQKQPLYRLFFGREKNISRDALAWNLSFSVAGALQTIVILFAVTRVCGDSDAGIISFAFSVAYLLLMIGNYGVKNYQATDLDQRYSFRDYFLHRASTCAVMMAATVLYVLIRGFEQRKMMIVFLCCLLKLAESAENVYYGEYQRARRLDVAGRIGTFRYLASFLAAGITLYVTRDLVVSLIVMNAAGLLVLIGSVLYTYPRIGTVKSKRTDRKWLEIYIRCFPLFLSGFMNIYISNASKYALEQSAAEAVQGHYGMIFSPVFTISLISTCIYSPFLVGLTEDWKRDLIRPFRSFIRRQLCRILGICILGAGAGWLLGVQVLSAFYGTDLSAYRICFMILLIGGGMTAVVNFMNDIVTVMRKQRVLLWIYGIVFFLALLLTGPIVKLYGVTGASAAYAATISIQALMLVLFVFRQLRKKQVSVQ